MIRTISIFLSFLISHMLHAQTKSSYGKIKKAPAFKVRNLGEPITYLGNYCGNTNMNRSELLNCDSLKIKYCFNLPADYIVTRYRFSCFSDGQFYSFVVNSCRLTTEIKQVLWRVEPGTKIKFTGIIGQRRDSTKKSFQDLIIRVHESTDTSLITYKLDNKIPEPALFSVKSQLEPKVTRLELQFVDQLFVKCDCLVPTYATNFKVVSFDLRTTYNGYKMIYTAKGADLTEEMRSALQHAKTGTKFHIEKIRVRSDSGITGYLSPRSFKVINP